MSAAPERLDYQTDDLHVLAASIKLKGVFKNGIQS